MYVLVIVFLFLVSLFDLKIFLLLRDSAYLLNNYCLILTKTDAHYLDIYNALICGKSLDYDLKNTQLLIEFSLIHWFVVSGSHFQCLKTWIQKINSNSFFLFILLTAYLFFTNFQSSALKSYVFLGLIYFNLVYHLNISPIYLNIISTVFCFAFDPNLTSNIGLILSTICCLVVCLNLNFIYTNLLIFVFIFPVVSYIGTPSVLAVPLNILLTPIVGVILFPLTVLGILFNQIFELLDLFFYYFFYFLNKLPSNDLHTSFVNNRSQNHIFYMWTYVFVLHFIFLLKKYYSQYVKQEERT